MAEAAVASPLPPGGPEAGSPGDGAKKRAAAIMASPIVTHSNYVPAQLHRQLEFIDFNRGNYALKMSFIDHNNL